MNTARKALHEVMRSLPGVPVGRYTAQLAIVSSYLDEQVNLKVENERLHRELAAVHLQITAMLSRMVALPAMFPDQAHIASIDPLAATVGALRPPKPDSGAHRRAEDAIRGHRPKLIVMDDPISPHPAETFMLPPAQPPTRSTHGDMCSCSTHGDMCSCCTCRTWPV